MAELPAYFQALAEAGDVTGLIPMTYHAREGNFVIAGKTVPLAAFDPFAFDPYSLGIDDDGIAIQDIDTHSLYLSPLPGRLLATPRLHRWTGMDKQSRRDYVAGVGLVVSGIYLHLLGGYEKAVKSGSTHFDAAVELREAGALTVRTIGSCACLDVDPHGIMAQGLQGGYGEYVLHNADVPAQYVSLYAGVGHLAYLADQES